MTTPELIQLFLFPTCFHASLRDQFCNWIAASCRLAKPSPESFQRSERSFQYQPFVFHSDVEGIALAKVKLLPDLRWNHDASLSTEFDLWHQASNVPELKTNGNKLVTLPGPCGSGGQSRPRHVDPVAAERDTLGYESSLLARALSQGAVGADHPPPGQVRIVALEENGAGEAGGAGRDVAVGADEAGRDLLHPGQDFEQAELARRGQLAGPKASMMRFWYSESSSGEMK